jgi:uncharacterized damage-inducible protein DinB
MSPAESSALRQQLLVTMTGRESQIDFDSAVADFPPGLRAARPAGAPHSAWQLLEHMRLAQHDILDFSRNPNYKPMKWPDDYWPQADAPPHPSAWDASVQAFKDDARALDQLVNDTQHDLFAPLPHGDGQTLLREALLVATHNSYHLGQLVFLKKMLTVQT